MKLVVVADNHGRIEPIERVLREHRDADHYIHCGDYEIPEEYLKNFAVVFGNNDYNSTYPQSLVFDVANHRVLVMHGHHYVYIGNYNRLVEKAKAEKCDVVFFGHTHIFTDITIDGIRLINPGSLAYNRDGTRPSYALVEIDENDITVKRINL